MYLAGFVSLSLKERDILHTLLTNNLGDITQEFGRLHQKIAVHITLGNLTGY